MGIEGSGVREGERAGVKERGQRAGGGPRQGRGGARARAGQAEQESPPVESAGYWLLERVSGPLSRHRRRVSSFWGVLVSTEFCSQNRRATQVAQWHGQSLRDVLWVQAPQKKWVRPKQAWVGI